tara:strand:+ start:41 stop:1093 length:1053 start_codon:yes stop_codon:yes gene_type:complete
MAEISDREENYDKNNKENQDELNAKISRQTATRYYKHGTEIETSKKMVNYEETTCNNILVIKKHIENKNTNETSKKIQSCLLKKYTNELKLQHQKFNDRRLNISILCEFYIILSYIYCLFIKEDNNTFASVETTYDDIMQNISDNTEYFILNSNIYNKKTNKKNNNKTYKKKQFILLKDIISNFYNEMKKIIKNTTSFEDHIVYIQTPLMKTISSEINQNKRWYDNETSIFMIKSSMRILYNDIIVSLNLKPHETLELYIVQIIRKNKRLANKRSKEKKQKIQEENKCLTRVKKRKRNELEEENEIETAVESQSSRSKKRFTNAWLYPSKASSYRLFEKWAFPLSRWVYT